MIEEKQEAVLNSVDYALMKICKHEIKIYNCLSQGGSAVNGIFNCLKVSYKNIEVRKFGYY